jgi:hypothetical protein
MSKEITPFEKIRQRAEDHFVDITEMVAIGSGLRVENHFVGIDQLVEIGSGAHRPLKAKP